jgi:hypothetical protein
MPKPKIDPLERRRPSLTRIMRASGRSDYIVEQTQDGTVRIYFGKASPADVAAIVDPPDPDEAA